MNLDHEDASALEAPLRLFQRVQKTGRVTLPLLFVRHSRRIYHTSLSWLLLNQMPRVIVSFPGRVMCCASVCGVANDASIRNASRIFGRVTESSSYNVLHTVYSESILCLAILCNETGRYHHVEFKSQKTGDEESHEQETTTSFIVVGMHDMMHLRWTQVKAVE